MSEPVKLIINNSYSQITGLTSKPFNELRKLLSYEIDDQAAYFSRNHFNTTRYLIDSKGSFPTGLLSIVQEFMLKNVLKFAVSDLRVKPTKVLPLVGKFNHEPYSSQQKACEAAIQHHQGTISSPTGTGKSMIMALIINRLKLKALIVVPNLEIKKQLSEDLTKIFGSLKYITVENIDSAELNKPNKYDLLLIDEAHRSAAKSYQVLNKKQWTGIYYRFFLTATPFRNRDEETLLFQAITGKVIYKLSYKEAIEQKYIVPVEAYFIDLDKTPTSARTWAQVYSELITNNKHRNSVIANLLKNLDDGGNSTLCLVKEVKHGTNIAELSNFKFANGQDEDTRAFIPAFVANKIKTLIGTEGLLGEGCDTKPAEYIIIAGLGKAKSSLMQKCGRGVRNYPGKESAKIIIFRDPSHKFTLAHFNIQKKILKEEYGVDVIKLDI